MSLFDAQLELLNGVEPVSITGRVSAVRGLSISVADFPAPVGSACRLHLAGRVVEARVIGFAGDQTLVMPLGRRRASAAATGRSPPGATRRSAWARPSSGEC